MTSKPNRRFGIGVLVVVIAMIGVGTVAMPVAAHGTDDRGTDRGSWWDEPETTTFDSASAEVVAETDDGRVSEVTFRYDAPRGELVRLQAGDTVAYRWGGDQRETTVELRRWFWPTPKEYPLNVSAGIVRGEECATTVTADDSVVDLCDDGDEEPAAAFDVGIDATSPATAGEEVTVEATIENVGDASGADDATVSVADQTTDESVSLDAGESTTVGLDWQTEAGDAGTYTATASIGDASASTDVTVDPVETVGTIEGVVTDGETGDAVSGAAVSAGGAETTTASDGSYSLNLADGDYTVSVSADDYESNSQDVTVTAGETATADLALTPVETDGTVEGVVTDGETGDAVSGATVSVGDTETTTTSDGSYSLTVADGDYTLDVSASDYQSASQEVAVTAGETTSSDVALDPVVTDGTVEGAVTDSESGDALSGATVTVDGTETTTGSDGSYSLTLAAGDHAVAVDADGYQSASQDVTVTAGETTTADLALVPEREEPREFTAYVRGTDAYLHTAVDNATTSPIEFTECRNYEPTQSAIDESPDYLPAPDCTTIDGTYYPSNDTWSGTVEFPEVVQERENDLLGDIYVLANITTDGATGTMDLDTGEVTMDATVDIGVDLYNVDSHGDDFANAGDPLNDASCRIPSVELELSSEASFDSGSSFTGSGTVEGQRLDDNGVAHLVSNDFDVDVATGCGDVFGIPLNDRISGVMGIPSDAPNNEVAFDAEIDLEN